MTGPSANPYSSPNATEKAETPRPRISLLWALFGLLFAPPVAGVVALVGIPLRNALGYAFSWLLGQTAFFMGIFPDDFEFLMVMFFSGFMMTTVSVVLFGLPLGWLAWRRHALTPRRVLAAGAVIALLWYGLQVVVTLTGSPDLMNTGSPLEVFQQVLILSLTMAFMTPLPLFSGFAAYAWWIRRLQRFAARHAVSPQEAADIG